MFVIANLERIRTASCVKIVELPLAEAVLLMPLLATMCFESQAASNEADYSLPEATMQLKFASAFLRGSHFIVFSCARNITTVGCANSSALGCKQ